MSLVVTYSAFGIVTALFLLIVAITVAEDRAARREHRLRQQSLKYQDEEEQ